MLAHHHKVIAFIAAVLVVLGLAALMTADSPYTHAQSSGCTNYYSSNIAIPSGYGAAYNIFDADHELLVAVDCSGASPHLAIGAGNANQYVYNKGYLYSNGWQSIDLTGTGLVSNAWYPSSASANLSGAAPTSWTYIVGYVCTWDGSAWHCGCADTACTTPAWQLQAYISSAIASGGGGSFGNGNGGTNGSGAGGQWAGSPDANAIVIAPSGSDGNPCNVNSPCQSLGKAQSVARGATDKTIYLRAGTYNIGSTITLNGSDNGETWMTYPGDPVDSAVLDGGGGTDIFAIDGPSNLTINGLKLQHVNDYAIWSPSNTPTTNVVVENCDMGFNNHTGAIGGFNPMIVLDNLRNSKIINNYVHDAASQGIAVFAYNAGDNNEGTVIANNYVTRTNLQMNDGGAIYMDARNANNTAGHVTIANNYVKDYGTSGTQAEGIYLDDDTSNVTVTGNVIGPMNPASAGHASKNTILNAGCCNTFKGNIIDVGSTGQEWISGWSAPGGGGSLYFNWTGPNVFTGNIIIANYGGGTNTCCLDTGNVGWDQGGGYPGNMGQISGNYYWNYGGGDTTNLAKGNIVSDSNPIHQDPQISGWNYAIAAGSPARSLSDLPQGGWGPPGFAIPTDGTAPSSPH